MWQAFLIHAANDPDMRAIIVEAVTGTQQELGRLLAQAQADGDLPTSLDPQRLGQALFALSYGLAQQVLIAGLTAEEAFSAIDATLAGLTDRASIHPPTDHGRTLGCTSRSLRTPPPTSGPGGVDGAGRSV